MFGKQSGFCEIFHAVVQRFCKSLDKRAAAGGAGFVELHAVYGLVFDFYAFHVLPADVQDTIHLRIEKSSGIIMGHRFHFAVIQQKGGFQ